MKTLSFKTTINAPAEKVWKVLWNDASYRQWTRFFSEGSYAESDWKEGSKVTFLNGDKDGMYSIIDKMTENQLMEFKHLGVIKNGIEQPIDEATKKWSGSKERYTLKESNGKTELIVEVDVVEEFESYMTGTFPLALDKIKELAEA